MKLRSALALGGALGAAACVWGTLVERKLFTLRHVTIPLLRSGEKEIRILHISDLHMAPWQKKKQKWLRDLARFSPDLVINTGDNLGHARGIEGIVSALDVFRGVPGVFVNGSNDYFTPTPVNPFRYFTGPSRRGRTEPDLDTSRLERYFNDLGWSNINNGSVSLTLKDVPFQFLGVNDPHLGFDRLDATYDAAHDDSRSSPSLTIGVAHAPYQRVLNAFVADGAHMIFAGHTHGGQVCIPGFGALVTNCDIPRTQVKGLSSWSYRGRSVWLHVSAGLGTSIYAPIRFACRPEATLITLTSPR